MKHASKFNLCSPDKRSIPPVKFCRSQKQNEVWCKMFLPSRQNDSHLSTSWILVTSDSSQQTGRGRRRIGSHDLIELCRKGRSIWLARLVTSFLLSQLLSSSVNKNRMKMPLNCVKLILLIMFPCNAKICAEIITSHQTITEINQLTAL